MCFVCAVIARVVELTGLEEDKLHMHQHFLRPTISAAPCSGISGGCLVCQVCLLSGSDASLKASCTHNESLPRQSDYLE